MAKKNLIQELESAAEMTGLSPEQRSIALVLLGVVAIIALVGLLVLLQNENSIAGALTYAQRWSYDSQPWNTEGYNCAEPTGCVVPNGPCGDGVMTYYVDGWQQACLEPNAAANVKTCALTTMRMGSKLCNPLDPHTLQDDASAEDQMKRLAILFSFSVLALVVGLAVTGYMNSSSLTGDATTTASDLTHTVHLGVVIIAALGILGVTLVNVVHPDSTDKQS